MLELPHCLGAMFAKRATSATTSREQGRADMYKLDQLQRARRKETFCIAEMRRWVVMNRNTVVRRVVSGLNRLAVPAKRRENIWTRVKRIYLRVWKSVTRSRIMTRRALLQRYFETWERACRLPYVIERTFILERDINGNLLSFMEEVD